MRQTRGQEADRGDTAIPSSVRITEGFPDWAWPNAWQWARARRAQLADDFFPSTIDAFVESYSVRFRDSRTYGVWFQSTPSLKAEATQQIEYTGRLGGVIIFEPASQVVVTAHILLSRRAWGIPASDLRQAATSLFDAEPSVIRIQAFIPAWNRLAIALAVRIGARIEGTLRCATMRNGQPADAVLVGFTREDLRGTELRRLDEFGQQQRDEQHHAVEHVFAGTDLAPEPVGIEPVIRPDGGDERHDVAGSSGAGDGLGGPDQQDVGRNRKPNKPVPRGARVRKVGRDGKRGPANGTRKAIKPRGK